jgi:Rieske Fe-S protein
VRSARPAPTAAPPAGGATTGAPGGAPATTGGDPNAIKVADIPVGGGKVFPDKNVVVTQPVTGQFKAFNATCKHMGCTVGDVSNGKINCPCHGSQYSITDGAVTRGPSTQNLDPKTATVNGTTIVVS